MTKDVATQKEQIKGQSYKSFPLFNEIEDLELRRRNQAVIMTNILEDNWVEGKPTASGTLLLIGYAKAIPPAEYEAVLAEFVKQANDRGFKIA